MWPFGAPQSYYNTINSKRNQRADAISKAPAKFSTEKHQVYLNASATQIVTSIQVGTWTASDVLEAYLARAVQAQEATNCLTEVFFEQAREEARKLDAEFAETGKLRGVLHGVPVSVKDQFNVAGFDSTIGYTQWANKPAESDSIIITTLRAAGAIPIAKTNIPQTLLAFESSNPLWGRTLNPWSAAHTAGGSSGGEGALLATDGAALGVGSDVGGSIRIPSGYCGLYALKPGQARVSYEGTSGPNPGFEAVRAVAGPMGRSVADVECLARVLIGERGSGLGYFPAPVPYRDVTLPEKLRFGYYLNDNVVKGSPACHRAVLETVEALRKAGHDCVEVESPDSARAAQLFSGITSADGYDKLLSHLGPDKRESALFLVTLGPRLPDFVRVSAQWLIRTFIGDNTFASLLAHSYRKTVREYYDYVANKIAFEQETRTSLWGAHDLTLDAVLAPIQAVPAIPHGGCDRLVPLAASTLLYNVVDSPVGVVPVTRVDAARDALSDEWRDAPGNGSKILEGILYGTQGLYDVKAMHGLPVGVQIVGRPWDEEKILAIMHVIDRALGSHAFGPGVWTPEEQTEAEGLTQLR
ncbi:amidase signature domain-containing protein [Gloeopeniophorella convolvens]|nr:amidase signature domain-containing protein [Gloeopeniophorella convolvens]